MLNLKLRDYAMFFLNCQSISLSHRLIELLNFLMDYSLFFIELSKYFTFSFRRKSGMVEIPRMLKDKIKFAYSVFVGGKENPWKFFQGTISYVATGDYK